MNQLQRAEEHLRVIRTLMERATIYRAISAPTALVGGALATIGSAGWAWLHLHPAKEGEPPLAHFVLLWLVVLAVTICANTFFVWQAARKRNEPVISPSMKLALRALFPPICSAAVVSGFLLLIADFDVRPALVLVWMLFYGLALLATAHFAPKSLVLLGWAFLVSVFAVLAWVRISSTAQSLPADLLASLLMGVTFGLFHLIYAVCTWPRGTERAEAK
jgi:hypothetical protein